MKERDGLRLTSRQRAIALGLDGPEGPARWFDWRWQLRHAVSEPGRLRELLGLPVEAAPSPEGGGTPASFPLRVTPYYLSLVEPEQPGGCPILRQILPSARELERAEGERRDPLGEVAHSPVPGVVHRYPDRALLHVTNACAVHCRHCTRRRRVGDASTEPSRAALERAIAYVRGHPGLRDVLVSGGEPLLLAEETLDWLLGQLRAIPHVEILRLGTRAPVVLPSRITPALVRRLRRHQPLWINTHFNHPRELVPEAVAALARLADAGFPLGNQSVLLAGVNDRVEVMEALVRGLVRHRVRPYYLYQCDMVRGLAHLRTPVRRGLAIIRGLQGRVSGLAIPTFVIDAPGGGGKIPVMPGSIVSWTERELVLRSPVGGMVRYPDPGEPDPSSRTT